MTTVKIKVRGEREKPNEIEDKENSQKSNVLTDEDCDFLLRLAIEEENRKKWSVQVSRDVWEIYLAGYGDKTKKNESQP
jgi:hypothetical protein